MIDVYKYDLNYPKYITGTHVEDDGCMSVYGLMQAIIGLSNSVYALRLEEQKIVA